MAKTMSSHDADDQVIERLDKHLNDFAASVLVDFLAAWPLMLAFGILHHRWAQIPAWSYLEMYVFCVSVSVVRQLGRRY